MKATSFIFTGLLFGAGLVISGMTQTAKVAGFLDFFGHWDPSLMLVMAGAIAIHSLSYFLIKKRKSPLLGDKFLIPVTSSVDRRLLIGSALFGLGWGLGGFCPGPAVTSMVSLSRDSFVFTASMLIGMVVFQRLNASPAQTNQTTRD